MIILSCVAFSSCALCCSSSRLSLSESRSLMLASRNFSAQAASTLSLN